MKLFRFLVRTLPRAFVEEHGQDLLQTVGDHWSAVGKGLGVGRALLFWVRQYAAVIRLAVLLRMGADRSGPREQPRSWLTGLQTDVLHSMRALLKRPGFSVVAVLTLGMGVGAVTAMFSAVHAVLLRPLPYADSERVVVLRQFDTRDGLMAEGMSAANTKDLADAARSLAHASVAENHGLRLTLDGRAISVRTWLVSDGFLEAIGARLQLGRSFLPSEYTEGRDRVVLLSHETWRGRFGADSTMVGRSLVLDGIEHTVVGVLQPGFSFPTSAGFWGPRPARNWDEARRGRPQLHAVARLAPDVDLAQAETELRALATDLARTFPAENANLGIRAIPLRDHMFGNIRSPLLLLLSAVGLVLLIASANVAGLQLARGAARAHEYALRGALGAHPGRIVRLVAVESLLLGIAGGALGVLLAYFGTGVIRSLDPAHLPRIQELRIDGTVLVFSILASVGSAVVAGVLPALRAAGAGPRGALAGGSRRTSAGLSSGSVRDRLVVAEIALALLLTVGAGLLIKSFDRLLDQTLGFDPENRLAVQVFSFDSDHNPSLDFFPRGQEALRSLPGVERVGLTSGLPLADDESILARSVAVPMEVEGGMRGPSADPSLAHLSTIDGEYPAAMGIGVRDGRTFDSRDQAETTRVAMVNETFARRYVPDGDPVGRRIQLSWRDAGTVQIVGVLADVRPRGYDSPTRPELFVARSQFPSNGLTFVLHTTVDPATLTRAVQETLWAVDPDQAVWASRTMSDLLGGWVRQRRFNTALLIAFSVLALSLAAIGVYGLMSFSVAQRMSELGIRRALGGDTGHILGMVLGRASRLALAGVGLGLIGSLAFAWLMRGMVFGIEPFDPATFLVVALSVAFVALAAAWVPARRATMVDPMVVLRRE